VSGPVGPVGFSSFTGITGTDPPGPTGSSELRISATGATGGDPPGATGWNDPLTSPIQQHHVFGGWEGQTKFLHGDGTTDAPGTGTGSGDGFEQLLAGGGQLATDLTNFGNLVRSLNQAGNDPSHGSGSQTTPETSGIGAAGQLDNSGKPEFKDLLPKDPSSSGGH